MQTISTSRAPQAIGPYTQGKIVGEFIFTSGQIALTPSGEFIDGDIVVQTRQVIENLKAILEAANSSLERVVKTSVFLSDMGDFNAMNEIYAQYFGDNKPARSTIAVKALPKDAKVEIECIAVR